MIKINGTTLDMTDFPERPTQIEAEKAMAVISAHLDGDWAAVKMSGAWFIYSNFGKRVIVAGDESQGQPRRASFKRALSDAGFTIIRRIPL
jgi:hypothetical protein